MGIYTKKVLEEGDIDTFGELMHQHWLTKKGLSENISDVFIDEAYDLALQNGAIGGKVVGAGGGGFLMLYCPKEKSKLINALAKIGLSPMFFSFEHEGAKIVFSK